MKSSYSTWRVTSVGGGEGKGEAVLVLFCDSEK